MPNIRQTVLIGAPTETVYRAVTSQEGLSGWWTRDVKAAAELNSIAKFTFADGYFKEMKITELDDTTLVKWLCMKGADEWIATTLSFKLDHGDKNALLKAHPEIGDQVRQAKDDQQTLLVFHHDNWKAYSPMFAECSYTWGRFLNSLKLLCETGKGRPWPHQHSN